MSQVSQDKCNSRHPNSPLVHLIANGLPRVIQNLEVGGISVTDKPLLCPWRRHWPRLCCNLCSAPTASGEPCLGFLKEGQNCKYFQGLFGKLVSYREELYPPLFSAVMLSEGSLHPRHCAYLGRERCCGAGVWACEVKMLLKWIIGCKVFAFMGLRSPKSTCDNARKATYSWNSYRRMVVLTP